MSQFGREVKKGMTEAMPIHEMSKYSKPNVSELQVH